VIAVYDIYYFSGTGNTKIVGEMIQKRLDCHLSSIEESHSVQADMILMYPIHGFGTPEIVLEWINQLEDSKGKVAIITTAADNITMNQSASGMAIKKLEDKGYKVTYDRIVIMPSNCFVAYPDEFCKQLYNTADLKAEHICSELLNNIIRRHDKSWIKKVVKPLYFGESKFLTRAMSGCLYTRETCTKCQICVKLCPRDNIDLINDEIVFSSKCMICMRCVYKCPHQSIAFKHAEFVSFKTGYDLGEIIKRSKSAEFVTKNSKGFYKHFIHYIEDVTI